MNPTRLPIGKEPTSAKPRSKRRRKPQSQKISKAEQQLTETQLERGESTEASNHSETFKYEKAKATGGIIPPQSSKLSKVEEATAIPLYVGELIEDCPVYVLRQLCTRLGFNPPRTNKKEHLVEMLKVAVGSDYMPADPPIVPFSAGDDTKIKVTVGLTEIVVTNMGSASICYNTLTNNDPIQVMDFDHFVAILQKTRQIAWGWWNQALEESD